MYAAVGCTSLIASQNPRVGAGADERFFSMAIRLLPGISIHKSISAPAAVRKKLALACGSQDASACPITQSSHNALMIG